MSGTIRNPGSRTPNPPCSAVRFWAYWLLAVGAAAAAFCSYVHVRHRVIGLGYELARERARRASLENERRDLRVELASFEAPADLAQVARDQLGLDVPGDDQVIELEEKAASVRVAPAPESVGEAVDPVAAVSAADPAEAAVSVGPEGVAHVD